jgi:2-polyprenyl-3-methyl-5-hydroxy-6-metoxy-1,4-benzoquinol methylase
MSEKEKYEKQWARLDYRRGDGGIKYLPLFLNLSKIEKGQSVIEFGCGGGDVSLKLDSLGYFVTPIDIASNALDVKAKEKFKDRFIRQDFTEGVSITADFAFSIDTMEHLPPDRVDAAIDVILNSCKKCYIHICTVPDSDGKKTGEVLHLSVHPPAWWRQKFIEHGAKIFHYMKKNTYVIFYAGLE